KHVEQVGDAHFRLDDEHNAARQSHTPDVTTSSQPVDAWALSRRHVYSSRVSRPQGLVVPFIERHLERLELVQQDCWRHRFVKRNAHWTLDFELSSSVVCRLSSVITPG